MVTARHIFVRGTVQGVGFRPFVYRLAHAHNLSGWVLNGAEGVEVWLEGERAGLEAFLNDLERNPPPAARIAEVTVTAAEPEGCAEFAIRGSERRDRPTTRITPDLSVCEACLAELRDPANRRYGYPYINCTDCGPRYSIITGLPYDRPLTTMQAWNLCEACALEYHDPRDRRFHAQPVACPVCGPHYVLQRGDQTIRGDVAAILEAGKLLSEGGILAVKGLGGYHLACDAQNAVAVATLRARKFRKEKVFAVMVKDVGVAREVVHLSPEAEILLTGTARPVVVAPARLGLPGVAPNNRDLGVMLPYTPLHHLLFDAGAPEVLVMTSANRSSEPITYRDEEAVEHLAGMADAFLVGERPIARRVDDSVVKVSAFGPLVLRRARGYAPSAVATLPTTEPILAVGADLKNSLTLVVDGQAFVSQHLGDLDHFGALAAFQETVADLTRMYGVRLEETLVVHDLHPGYRSAQVALELPAKKHCAVQHHRAHIAAVVAERQAWDARVLGVAFDGTGYGDDGAIWGGEFFVGSVRAGFERVAHLRPAKLPGGDAAARYPVQAAAGFLEGLETPDLSAAPFNFPPRYGQAEKLLEKNVQTFKTTSVGRLFDTVAALLGFTHATSFEGQAAMWLEHLARDSRATRPYPLPFREGELDFRPLLTALVQDRGEGRDLAEMALAFHEGLARGLRAATLELCETHRVETVVLSGGVFQNELLLERLRALLEPNRLTIWLPHLVPPNDGGISLGQAALGWAATGVLLFKVDQPHQGKLGRRR